MPEEKASDFAKASSDKKWKVEKAAGGVVFKKHEGQTFVLMVNPKKPNYGPPQDYWTWPKGLYDHDGESKEQTALREVREEGGVEAEVLESLGYIKFFRSFDHVLKFVDFWLMEYISGDPKDHDEEIANAEFVTLDEAEARLKFPHDKEILTRAKEKLTQY
ncbi:MAG TPA: NUDIX domain-containing protein [Patescibacteria group bacterium]|nr:NUDIX domain-containing protein [Patescibacteria group bacterium]